MYSSGVWSLRDRAAARACVGGATAAPSRFRPRVRHAVALELVLVALDLLLLAIHVPDLVAEEEVQIFVAVARQLLFDRLELEQQVVAEGADQPEAGILFAAELFDQRAQNRECRGLLAALFFGEERRQRLQACRPGRRLRSRTLPVR